MSIGLDASAIITKLGEMGIYQGQTITANVLNDAIANLIVENNKKIESDIVGLLIEHNEKHHK